MKNSEEKLIQQIRSLKWLSVIAIIVAVGSMAYSVHLNYQSKTLITTRGIKIQDDLGNDRILIGMPIPYSEDRVRTDSVKAWDTYVKRWPESYHEKVWGWFKDYNHSASGILFMSETGHDIMVMGSSVPDPSIGKRIAPEAGIVINNDLGDERTGYGVLKFGEEHYRVVLGLDSKTGTEGLALVVDDNGYNGLTVPGKERTIFLGNADTTIWETAPYEKYNGLIIRSKDSVFFSANSR